MTTEATHSETLELTGGCQCGAVRYRVTGKPFYQLTCHCRDCQYDSGGAPAHGFAVPREAFELLRGTPQRYEHEVDSGNAIWRSFCGRCGSPLFGGSPGFDAVLIKAGSLDDPEAFRPSVQIWTASAPSWHQLDPELSSFAGAPPR